MKDLLAQAVIKLGPVGGFKGPGGGVFADPATNAPSKFQDLFSLIIGVMTIVAGIWFMFTFLIGAIGIITSGGDKGAYATARSRITTGLVGLIIVVFSVAIINLIGKFLGFDILNIAAFLNARGTP